VPMMDALMTCDLIDETIALIRFGDPARHNVIDPDLDSRLWNAWQSAASNERIRCVVIIGEGDRSFSAGIDVKTYFGSLLEAAKSGSELRFLRIARWMPPGKPVIAAINGMALGGGFEIALAADIRIAAADARLGLPEVALGVLAGAGGLTRLPKLISRAVAAEMLLTGELIDANRAYALGLVSRVVKSEDLLETALGLARKIVSSGPLAIRATVDILRAEAVRQEQAGLADEAREFAKLLVSEDAAEGVQALLERRRPQFGGR
jgi:enoyl-CoA hydratase/carnithine racemase